MCNLALLQVLLVAVICFNVSKGSRQIICKDETHSPPAPSPLSSFTTFRSFPEDFRGIWFYFDSLEECARFCLLTIEVDIFNCTGFQYQHGGKCLLKTSRCLQESIVENEANFSSNSSISSECYILKGHYESNLCSKSTAGLLVSPTPTIQVAVGSTSTIALQPNRETSSCIAINITAALLDVRWQHDLSNRSSLAFKNLSSSLIQNIHQLYINDSTLCNVVPVRYRNFSTHVLAIFSVLFNESTRMPQFNVLFRALYRTHRIQDISITTLTDSLPGKPPANLMITMPTDSTADLSWTHAYFHDRIPTLGYKVTYTLQNTNVSNMIVIDHRTSHVQLKSLQPTSNYSMRITSITHRGFGESSLSLLIKTTNEVKLPVVINVTLNLQEKWNEDLLNKTHPASIALQTRLKDNINQMYSKQNALKGILIHGFRRATNSTNSTVQAHFGMLFDSDALVITKHLEPLYDALYRNNKLYNLSIGLIQDNIPGKPPTNISWKSPNPYTIKVEWTPSSSQQCGYFIYYKLNNSLSPHNNISVNSSSTHSVIHQLKPFSYYSIWIQSITDRGLGLMSDVIFARSLEQTSAVNLSFLLLNDTWNINLSDPNETEYKNLRHVVLAQVESLYTNNSQFREVSSCFFRNSSNEVLADLSITFGQDVSMSHFSVLYNALHVKKRIGDVHVRTINDTIPGKPPKDFTATPTGTTSIYVTWSTRHQILPREWLLFFDLVDSENTTLYNFNSSVNQRANQTSLEKLEKFAYYVIWIRGVTQWGLGLPSKKVIVRTLEEVVDVQVEILVVNLTANQNLSAIAQDIQLNVGYLYVNDSRLREVNCVVRNSSNEVLADLSITFGQDVSMSHFSVLYDALHVKRRIGDVHVRTINDTIPGKPPKDLTTTPTGTTSIYVTWSTRHQILPREWLLFFDLVDSENTTLRNFNTSVNQRANQTSLEKLEKFAYYVIWIRGVTQWGLGLPSKKIIVRTLEEVLPVNITLVLSNVTWDSTLLNSSSVYYQNTTEKIRYNIRSYFGNDTNLKDDIKMQFRNTSDVNVTVDISMVFSQTARAQDLNMLYEAIYRKQRIYELDVKPVTDNIPGKPPDHVTFKPISTTSILLNWTLPSSDRGLEILGFRVFYRLSSSSNNMSSLETEANITSFLVEYLEKFREYTFWVSSVTRIGTGSLSNPSSARTLEELQPINLVLRFPLLKWNQNLSYPDSEQFKNLSKIIKQNVFGLYGDNETQLREVVCNQFTNGSVIADIKIMYGQNVSMEHFAKLYRALYVDGQLYNLTTKPLNDNVPGKPPVNVTAKVFSSTSIQVTWSCSDCADTNSTIAFLVSYRGNNSRTNMTQGVVVNSTDRHVIITGLSKFTSYMLWVASVTTRGNGIASDIVYNTTLEDAPSKAPTNLLAYNTSSTTAVVDWEEVPIGYVHGILRGYVIEYKQQHNLSDQWRNVTVNNATITELTGLQKYTMYLVQVKAFTHVGTGPSANVTVSTDEDVPSSPPANIQAVNTSSTSVQVTWDQVPAGFAHGIVLGYHILYRRSNDSNTSHVIETAPAYNFTYVLRRLNKYTEYKIAMMAFTKKGNGRVSNEISVHTDEDTPGRPPPNVVTYNTSSTSLNVTWDQIPRYYIHGILRGYRVLYRESRAANGSYSNVTTLANNYEISGLKRFTHYLVKVLGFTVKGDGVASDSINVTTDEDVPSRAPLNVTGHNTSSTSVVVMWDQVPHGYLHGILQGYKVLYKIDNDGTSNYTFVLIVNTTRLAVLSSLQKFTVYRISVLAFTVKGNGPMAVNTTVTTDEDIPSHAPTNLTAHNLTSTSLMINWGPVPDGQLHGILRGYRVLFKMAANTSSNFTSLTTNMSTESLHVSSLKKFTVYLVKVLAFTVKGNGPTTINISVSTDEDVPSLPPQNLQSYNTSSTTLNVTWSDIPECCVHGILLGFRVIYRFKKRRSVRSVGNEQIKTVPSPTLRHVQLTDLVKFAEYEVRVLGYTRIGNGAKSLKPFYVTTDEDRPSKPPQKLRAHNTSSRSLLVSWGKVPYEDVHGILRGYRLYYKTKAKSLYVTRVMSRDSSKVLLTGLMRYTEYDIRISAFTRIGDGPNSTNITVRTDEDVPSEAPPNASPDNRASSTTIPVKWSQIPQRYVHGILLGYKVLYKLVRLADEPVSNAKGKNVTVRANETTVTLMGLESFAVYEIKVAGFTSKGDGKWATFDGVTCTCHPYMSTNWWAHPPYVREQAGTNDTKSKFNGLLTPIGGIFPPILMSAVTKCCGICHAGNGITSMDFKYDGHNNKAQKTGLHDVKDRIDEKTFISFPIGGTKDQTKYIGFGGEYEFVSIMDMPGAAFLVADRRAIHNEVLKAILGCWPTVIFVFVLAYLAGAAIWLIDVHYNPKHFPRSFIDGTIEGFWWAFITMTTVGYGDRIPKSVIARVFAIVWIWMGIATIAVLTSSITASLMSMVFKSDLKLYGTKVAAIDNSSEYKLGVRRNSILVGRYGNIYDIYRDLKDEKVHAALLDSYATASEEKLFNEKWLRVKEIIKTGFESTNGVVLGGDAQKLGNCMRNFMKSEENEIHKIVQRNVKNIKASSIPPAIKTSSSLLTSESDLFRLTALILGVALVVLVVLALIWEFGYRRRQVKKMMKKNNNNNSKDIEGSWPLWAKLPAEQRHKMIVQQMRKDLNEFYEKFKQTYEDLRRKHSLQLAALRKQKRGVFYFSVNEWTGGRSATYAITKDGDINSILDGLDLAMFDGDETDNKKKNLGFS